MSGDDIFALDTRPLANEGAWMTLKHPHTGNPLKAADGRPQRIRLYGADSELMEGIRQGILDKRLQKPGKAGKFKLSAEELSDEELAAMGAMAAEFDGVIFQGKEVQASQAVMQQMLKVPWVFDQVDEFINERRNFLPKS